MPRNYDGSSVILRAQSKTNYLGRIVSNDYINTNKKIFRNLKTTSFNGYYAEQVKTGGPYTTLDEVNQIRGLTGPNTIIINQGSNIPPPGPEPNIGSMEFTTGSSILYSSDPDFNLDDNQFTFEAWCKPSTLMTGAGRLFCIGSSDSGTQIIGLAFDTTTMTLKFLFKNRDPIDTQIPWEPDLWQHIAISGLPSLQKIVIFYNGVFSYQFFDLDPFNLTSTTEKLCIGQEENLINLSYSFIGIISDFRFVNGLGIYYSDNFTPTFNELDTTPQKTVLLLLSETNATLITDSSGLNKIPIATGITWTSDIPIEIP